jgi:hypothetical protein
VRFVVNTHWHGDHTGGNENLGRAGTVIVAHDNVRRRMSVEQLVRTEIVPPSPAGALPVVTFSDNLTFHLNGDDIEIIHVAITPIPTATRSSTGRAPTWLHMGDTFFNGMLPFIDLDSGGSIDGMIAAAGRGLEMANDQTVIIPGQRPGRAQGRPRALSRTCSSTCATASARHRDRGQTLVQIPGRRPRQRLWPRQRLHHAAAFTEAVYRSLMREVSGRSGTIITTEFKRDSASRRYLQSASAPPASPGRAQARRPTFPKLSKSTSSRAS